MNTILTVHKYIVALLLLSGGINSSSIDHAIVADRIKGCVFGGLIGDALGKPTEFIHNVDDIFTKYPDGISHF